MGRDKVQEKNVGLARFDTSKKDVGVRTRSILANGVHPTTNRTYRKEFEKRASHCASVDIEGRGGREAADVKILDVGEEKKRSAGRITRLRIA
ncbi:hypothetical protein KM043_010096 [Ampulex compressa]|nr:hypothetical protein KM043_010096 [Ampulex compressa]